METIGGDSKPQWTHHIPTEDSKIRIEWKNTDFFDIKKVSTSNASGEEIPLLHIPLDRYNLVRSSIKLITKPKVVGLKLHLSSVNRFSPLLLKQNTAHVPVGLIKLQFKFYNDMDRKEFLGMFQATCGEFYNQVLLRKPRHSQVSTESSQIANSQIFNSQWDEFSQSLMPNNTYDRQLSQRAGPSLENNLEDSPGGNSQVMVLSVPDTSFKNNNTDKTAMQKSNILEEYPGDLEPKNVPFGSASPGLGIPQSTSHEKSDSTKSQPSSNIVPITNTSSGVAKSVALYKEVDLTQKIHQIPPDACDRILLDRKPNDHSTKTFASNAGEKPNQNFNTENLPDDELLCLIKQLWYDKSFVQYVERVENLLVQDILLNDDI